MHLTLLAISAAIVGFVSGQSLGNVPACATNCVTSLLPASCNLNPECICKDANFINNISCCVYNACDPAGQTAALDYAKTLCTPVGATLPAQAGCSGNSTSTSGAASSSTTLSGTITSASSAAASSASAASSSASHSASSAGSGQNLAAPGLGLVGAIFGAVAML